jgi:FkbM family methyltransferase
LIAAQEFRQRWSRVSRIVAQAETKGPPKAGIEIRGRRIESALAYRVLARLDRPRAELQRLRGVPATWIVKTLSSRFSPEQRRRWDERGLLRPLEAVLRRSRLRIPHGCAYGMWLSTEHLELIGAQLYHVVRGTHEPMVQEALRRTLPPGGVLYDVGANVGFLSLVGARLVGPSGLVVSIDPESRNIEAIATNAALNQLDQIVTVHAAAAAVSCPVEIVSVRDTLWTRLGAVGAHPWERERFLVDGVALDDLASRTGMRPPDVVKIDVEGGEIMVLEGMTGLLAEARPALIIEMHGKNQAVSELLGKAGYELQNLEGVQPIEQADDQVHVLAVARSRAP